MGEVSPAIRPGSVAGTEVQFIRPVMLARMVSYSPFTDVPAISQGASFSFVQVL
jgi:hypothetical protein